MAPGGQGSRSREGVVLHMGTLGEAHRLVEVLCPEEGRLTLLARGARNSRRRFAGVLQLFAGLRLQVQGGQEDELGTLSAAEIVSGRPGIRQTLGRISRASALCACVRHLYPTQQAAPEAFAWLSLALDYVDAGEVARAAGAYPRLAQAAGVLPDLHRCGRCHAVDVPLACVPQPPGVLCLRCAPGRTAMSPALQAALGGRRVQEPVVANAVEDAVIAWTMAHSGRTLQVLTRDAG